MSDLHHLLSALGISVVVFVSTNVDDIVLLSAFFSDPKLKTHQVVTGQFLGIGLLVLVSAACARLALSVPEGYIGLLGVVPLVLGLIRLRDLRRNESAGRVDAAKKPSVRATRFRALAVAGVTVANGGDNLGVYIPLFSSSPALVPLYAAIFGVMTAAWCALGYYLVNNALLGRRIRRYGRTALPFVLIGLGLLLLSRVLGLIRG